MKNQERYELIKKLCTKKIPTDEVGQLPLKQSDIDDESSLFSTYIEPYRSQWEEDFVKNLIFGS